MISIGVHRFALDFQRFQSGVSDQHIATDCDGLLWIATDSDGYRRTATDCDGVRLPNPPGEEPGWEQSGTGGQNCLRRGTLGRGTNWELTSFWSKATGRGTPAPLKTKNQIKNKIQFPPRPRPKIKKNV